MEAKRAQDTPPRTAEQAKRQREDHSFVCPLCLCGFEECACEDVADTFAKLKDDDLPGHANALSYYVELARAQHIMGYIETTTLLGILDHRDFLLEAVKKKKKKE